MLEHGAYRLMLDHYYATGKSLPADTALLYRICKAHSKAEKAAVELVAGTFFYLNGDGSMHNKRADKEIGNAGEQAETNRRIAREREAKRLAERLAHEALNESCTNREPSHSHSQIPEKPKTKSKAIARSAIASSLDLGEGNVIETIPCLQDVTAVVRESYATELDRLFPAVDIPQTLREIRAWNLTNPSRRKTPKGIEKHISQWCQRVQNGGH